MAGKDKKKSEAAADSGVPKPSDHKGEDLGGAEVQAKMDEEQEKGFRGTKVDPTPNENYTVAGVTSGAPTPETDAEQAAEAGGTKFTGLPAKEKK